MSSGTGWNGGTSRCFTQWQKFQKCYILSDSPSECAAPGDDYLECLHHLKAMKHASQVSEGIVRQLNAELKEKSKQAEILSSGGTASVGLISKTKS